MHIFLVRHGHRHYTPADPELTEIGNKQAEKTGEHLQGQKITKALSSPMRRALQTAEGIMKKLNLPITVSEKLKERMEFDPSIHASFEDFLKEWLKASNQRDFQPSTGLSSKQAGKQIQDLLEEFLEPQADHGVLLVTHGETITDFLRNIAQDSTLEQIAVEIQDHSLLEDLHAKDYLVNHCSITHVEFNNGKWTIHQLNDTSHLGELYTPVV